MNKTFSIIVVVVIVGSIVFFTFFKNSVLYSTQEECERVTGKECYLFQWLCQVAEAHTASEVEANERFLKDCLSKRGTWQPIEPTSQNSDMSQTQNYYAKLADECKSKSIQNENCCLASVEEMKAGNYTLFPQEGCTIGYLPNTMLCNDSFRWCQPAGRP